MQQNRQFGILILVIFLVVGALGWISNFPALFSAIGLVLALIIWAPKVFDRPLKYWLKLGDFLHGLISPVVIFVLYFIIFLPVGLGVKAFGMGHYRENFSGELDGTWVRRGDTEMRGSDSWRKPF